MGNGKGDSVMGKGGSDKLVVTLSHARVLVKRTLGSFERTYLGLMV